jgi:hypothetical protein
VSAPRGCQRRTRIRGRRGVVQLPRTGWPAAKTLARAWCTDYPRHHRALPFRGTARLIDC